MQGSVFNDKKQLLAVKEICLVNTGQITAARYYFYRHIIHYLQI